MRPVGRLDAGTSNSASADAVHRSGAISRPGLQRARADGPQHALVFNLLMDLDGLASLLSNQLFDQDATIDEATALNAFFAAAGLHQILEDHLHREAFMLKRATRLASVGHPLTYPAARAATALTLIGSASRSVTRTDRVLAGWADGLALVLRMLAAASIDDRQRSRGFAKAGRMWSELRKPLDQFPRRLHAEVMRLPNFPYLFDLTLDDCGELAQRFTDRWPDRERPILVVGIRTSGTYLAPLYQAELRAAGYRDVDFLTVRPRQRWRRGEVARVRTTVERGGLMLLVDDPPTYGTVAGRVAGELEQLGAPRKSIVLILPLLGPAESLPDPLRAYESVLLPWREWTIQQRLSAASVQRALTALLIGQEVGSDANTTFRVAAVAEVDRIDAEANADHAPHRGHASAVYRACFIDELGAVFEQQVDADGLGLGYFADLARFGASALEDYFPQVYGIDDSVIYHRRLPMHWQVDLAGSAGLDERVVSYVLDRRRELALDADPTLRMEGYSVWRLVADILGRGLLGPLRSFAYPLTHEASRRLLAVARPCMTDGTMGLSNWFAPPSVGAAGALKSNWLGGAICCDAAFDLASAAASSDVSELLRSPDGIEQPFNDRLLRTYHSRTEEEIDGERWLLYELLANHTLLTELSKCLASAERRRRAEHAAPAEESDLAEQARRWLTAERALAVAYQRYIGGVFFADVAPPHSGPLCAFDVDWVLESRWFDFPAITPAAALGLRRLMRHGFRPVIATGRSLGEVRSRCRAFGLAGGVAEFGAVIYDHSTGRALSQVGKTEQAELDRLRHVLRNLPGVYLDHAHRYGIRALRVSENGERRGLRPETIQAALTAADVEQSVEVFSGGGQTDFGPISIDKGTGLRALARALEANADADRPLAFAIGDDWPDFAMLELARAPFVVPNMSKTLRDELQTWPNVRVVRDPHGAGVLQAVSSFLGHHPRRCGACQPPRLTTRQKLVITPLAGSDGPRRSRVRHAAALAALLLRSRADQAAFSELRELSQPGGSRDRLLAVDAGTTPRRPFQSERQLP